MPKVRGIDVIDPITFGSYNVLPSKKPDGDLAMSSDELWVIFASCFIVYVIYKCLQRGYFIDKRWRTASKAEHKILSIIKGEPSDDKIKHEEDGCKE